MPLTIEANGVLKPVQPLPLKEQETVTVTVYRKPNVAQETYGLMGWTGGAATVEHFALDPELDPQAGRQEHQRSPGVADQGFGGPVSHSASVPDC